MFEETEVTEGFYPSEYKKNRLTADVERHLGRCGRMLSGSKGQYRADNSYQKVSYEKLVGGLYLKDIETSPKNITVFNANIVTSQGEKVWYGDIDLTLEFQKVINASVELGLPLYVLHETDARFDNEKNPKLENYVFVTDPKNENGTFRKEDRIISENGRPVYAPEEDSEDSPRERSEEASQEDFELVKLKIEDIEEDDEEYEFYNEVPFRKFLENWTENNSPIHNFQNYLIAQGLDVENLYTRLTITKEDADRLKAQFTIWYELFHGEWESDYRKQSNIGWAWFSVGPTHFRDTPEWANEGKLYLRKERK